MAELMQGNSLQGKSVRGVRGSLLRDTLLVLAALAIGWSAHGGRPVQAASSGDLEFQMHGDDLMVYSSSSRTLRVYKGAESGNSALQCSYQFVISGDGGRIDRHPCDMGSLVR